MTEILNTQIGTMIGVINKLYPTLIFSVEIADWLYEEERLYCKTVTVDGRVLIMVDNCSKYRSVVELIAHEAAYCMNGFSYYSSGGDGDVFNLVGRIMYEYFEVRNGNR